MSLKSDLQDVFANMENDADFAEGISSAIVAYVGDLKVSAASVAGADSAGGTFSGAVQGGKMSIAGSVLEAALKQAASAMSTMTAGGDAILATAFVTGIAGEIPQWNITIIGTTTPPSPATPYPSTDIGTGIFVGDAASIGTALNSAFADMTDMTSGGDDKFATELANAIKTYYTSPVSFMVQGTTHLQGSSGSGTISE